MGSGDGDDPPDTTAAPNRLLFDDDGKPKTLWEELALDLEVFYGGRSLQTAEGEISEELKKYNEEVCSGIQTTLDCISADPATCACTCEDARKALETRDKAPPNSPTNGAASLINGGCMDAGKEGSPDMTVKESLDNIVESINKGKGGKGGGFGDGCLSNGCP
jgi:hypothetical protein